MLFCLKVVYYQKDDVNGLLQFLFFSLTSNLKTTPAIIAVAERKNVGGTK